MKPFFFSGRNGLAGGYPSFVSICIRFLLTVAASLVTIGLSLDRMVAEKIATALIMPCGLLWLLLLFAGAYAVAVGERRSAILILFSWCLLSVMGNGFLADILIKSLEAPYLQQDPLLQEPFDVVVVLGGGGSKSGNGRLQGNWAGDRMILAAQMYHRDIAHRFICTGQRIESMDVSGVDPSEVSSKILQALGVPAESMEQLGGRNTAEEMHELGQRFHETPQRVGLLTSAWHLPRALRLAERQGFVPIPIAADVRSTPADGTVTPGQVIESMIPGASAIMSSSVALKEYLGILIGR